MKKPMFSALMLCAVVVATRESRGDDAKSTLSPDQAEGKASFEAGIKKNLEKFKDRCGFDLVVKTDFENYDKQRWIGEMGSYYREPPSDFSPEEKMQRLDLAMNCSALIYTLADQCPKAPEPERPGRPRKDKDNRPQAAQKPTPTTPVKEVACLFSGYKAGGKRDSSDDVTLMNMSLKDGVFTLHDHPRLANIDYDARELLRSGGAKPDGPKNDGLSCSNKNDCKSSYCSKGTCKSCSVDSQCGGSRYCFSGTCHTPSAPSDEPSSSGPSSSGGGRSSSKPKGLERGRMCSKGSECQSGSCKMENRTRGKCQ